MNGTIDLIAQLATEFDRRGWRDPGDTAQTLARALVDGDSPRQAAAKVSARFLATNDITREEVRALVETLRIPGTPAAPRKVASHTRPYDRSAVERVDCLRHGQRCGSQSLPFSRPCGLR